MLIGIDEQLRRWASVCGGKEGLGYPAVTITWRLMREGAGAAMRASSSSRFVDIPEDMQAIDMAVSRLPDRLRKVIRLYYLDRRSVRDVAECLGVSKHAAGQQLDAAHYYLAGAIGDTQCVG